MIAATTFPTPVVIRFGDTMPQPEVTAIDAAGDPFDLNTVPPWDALLAMYDVYGNESLVPGARTATVGQVTFDVSQAPGDRNTIEVHTFTSMVTFGQTASPTQPPPSIDVCRGRASSGTTPAHCGPTRMRSWQCPVWVPWLTRWLPSLTPCKL